MSGLWGSLHAGAYLAMCFIVQFACGGSQLALMPSVTSCSWRSVKMAEELQTIFYTNRTNSFRNQQANSFDLSTICGEFADWIFRMDWVPSLFFFPLSILVTNVKGSSYPSCILTYQPTVQSQWFVSPNLVLSHPPYLSLSLSSYLYNSWTHLALPLPPLPTENCLLCTPGTKHIIRLVSRTRMQTPQSASK